MDNIISEVISNKTYLVAAILVLSIVVYFILKRLIKLLFILLIAVLIYISFIYYNEGKLPESLDNVKIDNVKGIEDINRFKDNIIETVKIKETCNGPQSGKSSSE